MTSPTATMEAALQCLTCGETRHWLGRVRLIPGPHPIIPWIQIQRPAVAVNTEQVSRWTSGHRGPIAIDHFHLLPEETDVQRPN